MNPPVFIVDTNVLVAGLISNGRDTPVVRILDAMLGAELLYLLSAELLDEYRAVLLRPRLVRLHGLKASDVDRLLEEIVGNAIWRDPQPGSLASHEGAPDRGDNHLWSLLHANPGSALITGDRLLIAHPPATASVLSPAVFVERFFAR